MNSQFHVYTSGDPVAPQLVGQQGSLLTVLDECLVTGYGGTNPPTPPWTKPFTDSGSIGCFYQGAGAGLGLVVNDNAPATSKEARMTGYEWLTGTNSGTNSFPTAAQGVGGVAMVVCRKSYDTSLTTRQWILVADSSTFYLFVLTGDPSGTPSTYCAFAFGDFYSLKSAADAYRCFISGRSVENSATLTNEKLDALSALNAATAAHFCARAFGGSIIGSITLSKHGDATKGSASTLLGVVPYPNPVDNGVYISPVWVAEAATSDVRGVLRGFYHLLHPIAGVTSGQVFNGTLGGYAGKEFQVISPSGNSGQYLIEISNTVNTN